MPTDEKLIRDIRLKNEMELMGELRRKSSLIGFQEYGDPPTDIQLLFVV